MISCSPLSHNSAIFTSRESDIFPGYLGSHLYSYIRYPTPVTWILGVSLDALDDGALGEFHQVNPKLGVIWNVTPYTVLRLAAFRALKRSLLTNQTIEPTQLAGFNQFFDDS